MTGVVVVAYLVVIRREKRWQTYLAVLIFAGIYAGCFKLLPLPEERVHFPQYGFLALFTYRAVTLLRPGDAFAFLWSRTNTPTWLSESILAIGTSSPEGLPYHRRTA